MILGVLMLLSSTAAPDDAVRRAEEVLAAARTAVGAEGVAALSVKADLRRSLPGPDGRAEETSGELRLDAILPGRYRKSESVSPFPGAPPFTVITALDAESAWTATPPVPSGGGMVIRMRGPRGTDGASEQDMLRRRLRAEYARLALGTLLATDAALPLEMRYAAVAEAPEGRADVLEATGPDGFAVRLFVDQATHLPLMMSYPDRRPRIFMRRAEGPAPPPDGDQVQAAPIAAEPPLEEATLHFEDFRSVNGRQLPHRITLSFDGQPTEEWIVEEYKINPPLTPEAFSKK